MTSPQIIAVMALMREIEKPSACYNRAVRRASQTLTDSPENGSAQARGNAALLEIEQAVRDWVAKHPGQADTVAAPTVDRATVLNEAERAMLDFALNQAQLRMWAVPAKFTEGDQAALNSLRRRMAAEAQQPTPAVLDPAAAYRTALYDAIDAIERLPQDHSAAINLLRHLATGDEQQPAPAVTEETVPACKCGHPQKRHALLSGTYAQCRHKYTEAGRPKCPCGMYRPQGDAPAPAEETK